MSIVIEKINSVNGTLNLPGDKSVSHRAVFFSSLADGKSRIINCLNSEDLKSSINCFKKLGAEIIETDSEIIITGTGLRKLVKPESNLDAGNSGTTARLISGILAGQKFGSTLLGDKSLSSRPMKRIIDPLSEMGGIIESTDFKLPIIFHHSKNIHPITYTLPVASAQVKSSVLLAGLHIDGITKVIEETETRDHTERMLGLDTIYKEGRKIISVSSEDYPTAKEYLVPSDISTASFFIILGLILHNSEIKISNLLLNPSRTGIIEVLREMGGNITEENVRTVSGEIMGDLVVKSSSLKNIKIRREIIPNIIDEIPILSIAGYFAEGDFIVDHAEELRYKESDRIKSICTNFSTLGVKVVEQQDGFSISGEINKKSSELQSFGDHRIAMSFAVLSALIGTKITINNYECVAISNPDFLTQLKSISDV